MGKFASQHLGVVQRQITRDVIAFLQVGLGVGFNHLSVHDLVATIVLVLIRDISASEQGTLESFKQELSYWSTYQGLVKLYLLLVGECKELLGNLEHLFLETEWDGMVDDLEEALGGASSSDLIRNVLHPLLVSRQKAREVNDWGNFGGSHSDKFGTSAMSWQFIFQCKEKEEINDSKYFRESFPVLSLYDPEFVREKTLGLQPSIRFIVAHRNPRSSDLTNSIFFY